MSMIKYRIHEVAKDFNVPSKVISQILTDYIAPPKNHMQVLENNELDVIFDYMTQHNQVASLQDIFNVPPKAETKEAKPKVAEPAKTAPAAREVYHNDDQNEQRQVDGHPLANQCAKGRPAQELLQLQTGPHRPARGQRQGRHVARDRRRAHLYASSGGLCPVV